MDKNEIVTILQEFGVLLELKGANPFKIRAFYNASRSVDATSENLEELSKQNKLTDIPGVGKGISQVIKELLETGRSKEYEELKQSFPKGFLEILRIPGVGPKRAKVLYEKLGVKSVAELQYACEENRLLTLEGFGEKSQSNILKGIEHRLKTQGYFLVSQAQFEADRLMNYLKKKAKPSQISIAGSLRRHKEIVHDADILVSAKNQKLVHDTFAQYPEVEQVTQKGDTKSSVVLKSGLQVDLRSVSAKEFPYALQYFTGSKEHNVVLRSLAKRKGYKINEYGLFKGKKFIACQNEAEIYEKLGLIYIEPELRENTGEIEAAQKKKLPKELLQEKDIKGVFHVHSTYSDGAASLEEMIQRAIEMGYQYVGISDHSKSATYANGLSEERIKKQHGEIDKLQRKHSTIRIFKGIESDILPDGSLDYADPVLDSFDFVIASIHSRFNMDEKSMTKRLVKAMENPYATMIGHVTGRLLLGRVGYSVNYEALFHASQKSGCTIELNANPHRLDLDWRVLRKLKEKGLKTVINPDAHDLDGFNATSYGVGIARKGWLERRDVLNTMNAKEMEKYLKSR